MLTIPDRILAQARRSPRAIAVESGGDRLTYAALAAQACGLAARLRRLGIRPGEPVAVAVPRGVDVVPALLGVQLSGAAYVPLDPEHPSERSNRILRDTAARILVTADAAGFPGLRPQTTVALDDVAAVLDDPPALDPDSPAYVIHTSGSTGRPKGVLVTHRSILNHHQSMRRYPGIPDGVVMPAVATVSFDPSTVELFLPLMTGGRVVVARQSETADPHRLAALLERSGARILQATPVTWRLLTESGWSPSPGFTVLTGGERMPAALAERLLAAGAVVWDLYGPTETTVWATMTRYELGVPPRFHTALGASMHVLDDALRPAPDGELYIGGTGLAVGYLGRPALTAERYVANPFADVPGERLYRTGDIARRHPDGRVEILGRADDQIKIRGFRIEPGEIESALTGQPGVAAAVVRAVEEPGGERRLVGYIRPGDPADPPRSRDLRTRLAASLPSYMVPTQFVILEEFPTTDTGKVDRRALPSPPPPSRETAAGTTQDVVAAVLADVLRQPDIGLHDDFFELGGDSLLAVQTILRLNEELDREVPINALFEERTVYGLALLIDTEAAAAEAAGPRLVPRGAADGVRRLSPPQLRLLLHQDAHPECPVHNEALAIRLPEPFDAEALREAVRGLVARHEILRTRYGYDESGRPVPVVLSPAETGFGVGAGLGTGLDAGLGTEAELVLEDRDPRTVLEAELARPFDPREAPPVRFRLCRPAGEPAVLVVVVHRIAADAWSRNLMARQIRAVYRGRAVSGPDLTYADYTAWRRELATGPEADRHVEFWRAALAGVRPARLRTDRPRPAHRDWRGGEARFTVPAEAAEPIRELAAAHDTAPATALLAAAFAVLDRHAESFGGDLTIGVPVERRRPELEDLVGAFEDPAVVRVGVGDRPAFERLLARVRDAVLAARDHAMLPFEDVVAGVFDLLPDAPEPGRNPLFDVWFEARRPSAAGEEAAALAVPSAPGTEHDLSWHVLERADGGFDGRIAYSAQLFDPDTVERMAEDYLAVLRTVVADPGRPIPAREADAVSGSGHGSGHGHGASVVGVAS